MCVCVCVCVHEQQSYFLSCCLIFPRRLLSSVCLALCFCRVSTCCFCKLLSCLITSDAFCKITTLGARSLSSSSGTCTLRETKLAFRSFLLLRSKLLWQIFLSSSLSLSLVPLVKETVLLSFLEDLRTKLDSAPAPLEGVGPLRLGEGAGDTGAEMDIPGETTFRILGCVVSTVTTSISSSKGKVIDLL